MPRWVICVIHRNHHLKIRLAHDPDGHQYEHFLQFESFAEKSTALVIPAAYASTTNAGLPGHHCAVPDDEGQCPSVGLLIISRGTAMLLLVVYCAYIWFQACFNAFLPQCPFLFKWIVKISQLFIRWSKSSGGNGASYGYCGGRCCVCSVCHSLHYMLIPTVRLLSVTAIVAFCAEFREWPTWSPCFFLSIVVVVASIEETAVRYHIPKAFIGVVLLPIVVCFTPH